MATHPEPKILVAFYSFTGHTAELAHAVAKGAGKVTSQVTIRRIPELIPEDAIPLQIRKIEHVYADIPLATSDDLVNCDGLLLGGPTHFSGLAAQVKQYLDQFGPIWQEGKLVDKVAGVFTSMGSLHGGEETTLLMTITTLIGMGLIPVGIPYPIKGASEDFDAGSPFGAIHYAGHDGSRSLQASDRLTAELLGERVAKVAAAMLCCKTSGH